MSKKKIPPNTLLRTSISRAVASIPVKPENINYPNTAQELRHKGTPRMDVSLLGSVVTEELVDGSFKQQLVQLDIHLDDNPDNQREMEKYIDSVQAHFAEDNQVGEFTSVASPETLTPRRENAVYSETISFNLEYFVEY